jgi:hypothetical protein
MNKFSPQSIESLQHYVYVLVDPRKNGKLYSQIFYVGKGLRNRCFEHAEGVIDLSKEQAENRPNPKLHIIKSIKDDGEYPAVFIISHGIENDEALALESVLIKLLETEGNKVAGHRSQDYVLPAVEIERRANPILQSTLPGDILIVSLNGGTNLVPYPSILPADLPARVLGKWVISKEKAEKVRYVVGVYKQLVRCVFEVDLDSERTKAIFERVPNDNMKRGDRTVFSGKPAGFEANWIGKAIVDHHGNVLSKIGRNGTRYVSP